jgi:hypothetical protein
MSKVIFSVQNNNEGNTGASRKMCQEENVCASYFLTGEAQMSGKVLSLSSASSLSGSVKPQTLNCLQQ